MYTKRMNKTPSSITTANPEMEGLEKLFEWSTLCFPITASSLHSRENVNNNFDDESLSPYFYPSPWARLTFSNDCQDNRTFKRLIQWKVAHTDLTDPPQLVGEYTEDTGPTTLYSPHNKIKANRSNLRAKSPLLSLSSSGPMEILKLTLFLLSTCWSLRRSNVDLIWLNEDINCSHSGNWCFY